MGCFFQKIWVIGPGCSDTFLHDFYQQVFGNFLEWGFGVRFFHPLSPPSLPCVDLCYHFSMNVQKHYLG